MRITKWGEYGILCCLHLAKRADSGPIGAVDIANSSKISLEYTHQILQRLRKGGVITSARGPHGGYLLAETPDKITLKQILQSTEGDTFEVICEHDPIDIEGRCQAGSSCALRGVWMDLKTSIDAVLQSKTLAQLVKLENEHPSAMGAEDQGCGVQISPHPSRAGTSEVAE